MYITNTKGAFLASLSLLISLLIVFAVIRMSGDHRFERQADIMGTLFTIKIEGPGDHERAAEVAFEEIRRIDRLLSVYKPDSEISEVNQRAAFEPVVVGADFLSVLAASRVYFDLSGGAFDPSIVPLTQVWKEARRENRLPSEEELRKAVALVDLAKVEINAETDSVRFLQEGMALDFGGIAKGYAVDRAVEALKAHGVEKAIIDAGGNFYAFGIPVRKSRWEAGVRHPLRPNEVIMRFPVSDKGVATSGSYERFFEIGGRKYSHIIDPHTGWPVEGMLSATIVADDATTADGLSTSVFVLGPREGMRLIERLPDVEGVIIAHEPDSPEEFSVSVSSGLRDKVELLLLNNNGPKP